MVRVHGSSGTALGRPTSASDILRARGKRHDKQALVSAGNHMSYNAQTTPPDGYTFLAIGYPELIKKCKELSADRGVKVRDVSKALDEPGGRALTGALHRIGYHIRTDIFDEACQELNYYFAGNKLVHRDQDSDATNHDFTKTFARFGADLAQMGLARPSARQELATKVKSVIRELFPYMPNENVDAIFDTSWQEGANTVGNNSDLPLARKVQLATVAHVRHVYTDYDRLLGTAKWHDSRRMVEKQCLDMILEWSGKENADDAHMEALMTDLILPTDDENDQIPDWNIGNHITKTSLGEVTQDRRLAHQHDISQSTGHIDVPVDHRGRGPKAFVKDGFEFTKVPAPPQAVHPTSYGLPPPPSSLTGLQLAAMQQQGNQPPIAYATAVHHSPPGAELQNVSSQIISHPARATEQQSLVEINGQLYQLVPAHQPQPSPRRFFDTAGREVSVDPLYHTLIPTNLEKLPPHSQTGIGQFSPPLLMPPPAPVLSRQIQALPFVAIAAPPPAAQRSISRAQSGGYAETVVDEGEDDDYDPGALAATTLSVPRQTYSSSPSTMTEDVTTQIETMYDDSDDYDPAQSLTSRATHAAGVWRSRDKKRRQQGARSRRR